LLHADCNQPVGVFAFLEGTLMKMRAQVFWPSGNAPRIAAVQGKPENAEQLAAELLRATNGE
jgi:porphobilinogen deaminase